MNLNNYPTSNNYYKIHAWSGGVYRCELWIPNYTCDNIYPIAQFSFVPFGNPDCYYIAYSDNGPFAVYHWILDNGQVLIKTNDPFLFCSEINNLGGNYPVSLTVTNPCGMSQFFPGECLGIGNTLNLFPNPAQDIRCIPIGDGNPLMWNFDLDLNPELTGEITYSVDFSDGSDPISGSYDNELGIFFNHTFPRSGCFIICIEIYCSTFNVLPADCPTRFCKTICIDGFDCNDIFRANCNISGSSPYQNSTDPNDNYLFPPTSIMDDHFDCHDLDDGCEIISPLSQSQFRRNEQMYQLDPPNDGYANKNVTIDLCWEDNIDLDVFAYTRCYQDGLAECAYTSTGDNRIGNNEAMFIESADQEEYFIVVDGQSNNSNGVVNEGEYTLSITCGELCDHDAEPIYCEEPIYDNTYNEFNYASFYCGDCINNNGKGQAGNWGPEKVYYFDVEFNNAEVEIELDLFSDQDLDLYLLSRCNVNSCIANSRRFFGNREVINVTLNVGRYYVVVEGYKGASSDFELTVSGCKETYCDLFLPFEGSNGQYVQFDNTTPYDCKAYSIYFMPNTDMDEMVQVDSIIHVEGNSIEYYCPRPGCYVFCFYYCDQFGNIQRCCVKYCAQFTNWGCSEFYPYVRNYVDNKDESCNVTIGCFYSELIPQEAIPDSTYYTINEESFLPNNNGSLDLTGLPYNEYEICCWSYFEACDYWEVCCKTFCFPYVGTEDQCVDFEGLEQGSDNTFSHSPRDDNFDVVISPTTGWSTTCTNDIPPSSCVITFEPGNYRVCYYEKGSNRLLCCEYICIDPNPVSEECMEIIPYRSNHVLLNNSNEDHTTICWNIYKKIGDVRVEQVVYGDRPLVRLDDGFEYEICKKYYGCCDEILECCETICF